MENSPNIHDDIFDISFDQAAKESLRATASWAKIIAILGFVSYGVSLLGVFLGKEQSLTGTTESSSGAWSIISTIVTVAIGVTIAIFLLKFARKTLEGVNQLHQGSLEEGFSALRYYFKIQGILLIIALSFLFFFIIVATATGFSALG